ncbi:MAG TPA: hypothetical protein VGH29_04200 [Candidatus Binataceae bacterium]
MKRGLTILTAALFAGALALPAMAQSTDSGMKAEAPAAGAVTGPGTASTDNGAVKADDRTKADASAMKPADDPSAQQKKNEDKPDSNTTSDAGSNPAGPATAGHPVE